MESIKLSVERRFETGKGPARRCRAAGKAPAIFYGKKTEPISLTVDVHEFRKLLDQAGTNPLFDLLIQDGDGTTTRRAMLKARQVRPVDGSLVHLDFQEVFMDERIEVTVQVEFEGKPIGIDKGGILQIAVRELRVSCLPGDVPGVITVDVSGLDVGHALHVGEITLPDGVLPLQDKGVALATVAGLKKEEAEEAAEAAGPATT